MTVVPSKTAAARRQHGRSQGPSSEARHLDTASTPRQAALRDLACSPRRLTAFDGTEAMFRGREACPRIARPPCRTGVESPENAPARSRDGLWAVLPALHSGKRICNLSGEGASDVTSRPTPVRRRGPGSKP